VQEQEQINKHIEELVGNQKRATISNPKQFANPRLSQVDLIGEK
jgi:hypothetical protein